VDKTAAAATQVTTFFGTATPAHFGIAGSEVTYSGPNEWSYRRFVLHLAKLSVAAGGVDGFVIGSEMRGLTTVRSSASAYPAVTQLKTLAADVRTMLGATPKMAYAADWSEYFGHQPTDGSGDVFFHLDPLWSDANIDAVGVDYYAPLSDWRDGLSHADAQAGAPSPYDQTYLQGNVEAGEGYDWYYASQAARDAQTRNAITDGAYAEHWVFRYKDLRNWWLHAHHDRPGGVRNAGATAWTPQSKPIWLTEFGCPAVDKGANQPNVFFDPKSSESALPYYSGGRRDDFQQRRFLEALIDYWTPAAGHNPNSAVYGGRMIDPDRMFVWAWDARPYPDYPLRASVWRDAANWEKGHWLSGRMGLVPVQAALEELCLSAGVTQFDASGAQGLLTGYVVADTISAKAAIEPITVAYHLNGYESAGTIRFGAKSGAAVASVAADDLLAPEDERGERFKLMRAQEADLPVAVRVSYSDAFADYRAASVEARKQGLRTQRVMRLNLDLVLEASQAQGVADRLAAEAFVARESAEFKLPPSRLALEPGDALSWTVTSPSKTLRIGRMVNGGALEIEAEAAEPSLYELTQIAARVSTQPSATILGAPAVRFLDLPLLLEGQVAHAPFAAASATPWPGRVAILKAVGATYALNMELSEAATMGATTTDFYKGPEGRWDRGNAVWVKLYSGALQARGIADVLSGANAAAIQNADGGWETIQFANAELVDVNTYKLSLLLRGQAGSEGEMRNPVAAGAPFVLLGPALRQLDLSLSERNLSLNWRYGPSSLPVDDARYTTETRAFAGVGLRPLSPDHVRGKRDGATNDVTISWIRRTRIGGDAWDGADAPLGETSEGYTVEVLNGAVVVRTLTVTAPQALYTAAQQVADFGSSTTSPIDVRVSQSSEIFGKGQSRTARLYV
jgi:hypothetical protein